jgi:hypothetical protein
MPLTNSITKYGRPLAVAPASKTRAMFGWSLKAGDHVPAVHARLDDFQCHLATNRMLLFGDKDKPKPAFTDLLHELVRADDYARPLRYWLIARSPLFRRVFLKKDP